jgi:uncharacterized protein
VKALALALIAGYQRYLSPHKGYCCAYRAHTARASCSALGHRAVRMHGVVGGLAILRERLFLCGVAHRRYAPKRRRPPIGQRGDCDIGCVDLPIDGDCLGSKADLCQLGQCADCGSCDWRSPGNGQKRKGKAEQEIHLPEAPGSTDAPARAIADESSPAPRPHR